MNKSRLRVIAPFVEGFDTTTNYWGKMDELIGNSKNVQFEFLLKTEAKVVCLQIQKLQEKYPQLVTYSLAKTNEYLWDSLIKVEIGEFEWILQIHQDDDWSGFINFPDNLGSLDTLLFNFYADETLQVAGTESFDIFPGRSAFCAVPKEIWQVLRHISKEMSWKVAPSLDSVLAEIVKSYGNIKYVNSFTYYYSVKNWKGRLTRRRHLASLMKYDVWRYAPVEMSVVNRDLDLMCCQNLIATLKGDKTPTVTGQKLHGVSLSKGHLLSIRLLILKAFLYFRIFVTIKPKNRKKVRLNIAYLEFMSELISLSPSRDNLIECLQDNICNPKLSLARDRIGFWLKYI